MKLLGAEFECKQQHKLQHKLQHRHAQDCYEQEAQHVNYCLTCSTSLSLAAASSVSSRLSSPSRDAVSSASAAGACTRDADNEVGGGTDCERGGYVGCGSGGCRIHKELFSLQPDLPPSTFLDCCHEASSIAAPIRPDVHSVASH